MFFIRKKTMETKAASERTGLGRWLPQAAAGVGRALRATARLLALAAMSVALMPAQALVAGPLLRNFETLPRLMNKGTKKILGLRVVYKGVAPAKGPGMMYIANHLSWLDSVVMGNFISGALISKFGQSPVPFVKNFGAALGVIFVQSGAGRKAQGKFPGHDTHGKSLAEVHKEVARALNRGRNILVFPEGKSSDGRVVAPFKAGVLTIMFNNASAVPLKRDVKVQPFGIRVTAIDGKDMTGPGKLSEVFAWYSGFSPKNLWTILKTRNIDIEVTGLPVLQPKFYTDRNTFTAAAEDVIRAQVVTPRR
jgi:1-acyl-sn-glycerol-3-phosphate acyltransferase